MERLTERKDKNNYWVCDVIKNPEEVANKLGQLEDIEQELGIELSVLVKTIMTTGVKWENEHGFIVELNKDELKEIAKKLTKEELEK